MPIDTGLLQRITSAIKEELNRQYCHDLEEEEVARVIIPLVVEACAEIVDQNETSPLPCGGDKCLAERIRKLGGAP